MRAFYHTTGNGTAYRGDHRQTTLEGYKAALRKSYGSLRGVVICNAKTFGEASRKLLYQYRTWDGKQWVAPPKLID